MKTRYAAIVLVMAMVAVACGQKPGVHQQGAAVTGSPVAGSQPVVDPATGATIDPATGQTIDPATGQPAGTTPTTDPGTGTGTGTSPTTDPGTGTTPTTGSPATTPPPGGGSQPTGGDSTGVTSDKIVIGLHAPVTGAAPVRSDSFNTGRNQYWEKGNNGGPVLVHGRKVEVVFADDRYNPSTARSECARMAEQDKAFLLIGGAGTDQIKACAQYAAAKGIPYLSAGVTEIGLDGLGNYFGVSMSYPDQAPLLGQYAKKNFPSLKRVAIIATDTANFDDAANALKSAFPGSTVYRPSKSARGDEMSDEICTATTKKFDIVVPLTSPTFFLQLEGSAACNPQYLGIGLTQGVDTVPELACQTETGSIDGARFLNPFYAFHDAKTRNKNDFIKAGGSDDLEFALWGINKTIHQLLLKAGKNLTREGFIASTQNAAIKTGVFPDLSFQGGKRWGANQVHVVEASCQGDGHYETLEFFKSSF